MPKGNPVNNRLLRKRRKMEAERARSLETAAIELAFREFQKTGSDEDLEKELGLPFFTHRTPLPVGYTKLPTAQWDAEMREYLALNCYTIGQILARYRVDRATIMMMRRSGLIQVCISMGYRIAFYSRKEIDFIFKDYKRTIPPKLQDLSMIL